MPATSCLDHQDPRVHQRTGLPIEPAQGVRAVGSPRLVDGQAVRAGLVGGLDHHRETSLGLSQRRFSVGEHRPGLIEADLGAGRVGEPLVVGGAQRLPRRGGHAVGAGQRVSVPGDQRGFLVVCRDQHPVAQSLAIRQIEQVVDPAAVVAGCRPAQPALRVARGLCQRMLIAADDAHANAASPQAAHDRQRPVAGSSDESPGAHPQAVADAG